MSKHLGIIWLMIIIRKDKENVSSFQGLLCDLWHLSLWSCNNMAEKFYDGACTGVCVCVCLKCD